MGKRTVPERVEELETDIAHRYPQLEVFAGHRDFHRKILVRVTDPATGRELGPIEFVVYKWPRGDLRHEVLALIEDWLAKDRC